MISHFFIDRPIFACVVCLVILLFGVVAIPQLAIEQFPEITPPVIMVRATYPGANAEDVANAVAIPIEQQLNGVDNMLYMETSCTSDGSMTINISFEVGTDPDIANVLVQNRVKLAEPLLPEEVKRLGVAVIKRSTSTVCFFTVFEKTPESAGFHDESMPATESVWQGLLRKIGLGGHKEKDSEPAAAEGKSALGGDESEVKGELEKKLGEAEKLAAAKGVKSGPYLCNYASLYLKDRLARVKGVGEVMMFDARDFSMRVWMDEDTMAARAVSVSEVAAAIQAQNVQFAAGRIGQEPIPVTIQKNLAIVTLGRLAEVSQFENVIIRVDENGGILRLKDIAKIELGSNSYQMETRFNGLMATGIGVSQRSGANAMEVATLAIAAMEAQRPALQRSGLDYALSFNATEFISATVHEFVETLILCVLFVVLTVYIFLQDWRAALIPTLTIPVSIIGTFFIMFLFGFSINTMTLFGLILVIGIVVDDAIVVVENTQRIIDEEHLEGHAAAKKSMNQVIGPVIATVLVMIAVFVPTAMMSGIVGKLYKQFALTIAGAVFISGVCGVTLAPALCAILLRPSVAKNKRFIGFRIFNWFFDGFTKFYLSNVKLVIMVAPVVLLLWAVLVGFLLWVVNVLPSGFVPTEDQGVMFCDIALREGATQKQTAAVLDRLEKIVERQKVITRDEYGNIKTGGVAMGMFVNGFSFMGGQASNRAMCIMRLETWDKRKEAALKPDALQSRLKYDLETNKDTMIPEAQFMLFTPPPIMGLGLATGVVYQLLDERDTGSNNLYAVQQDVVEKAVDKNPRDPDALIVAAMAPFNPNSPRLYLDIDREKAMRMGLNLGEVRNALQSYLGAAYINDFNKFGRTFRVNIQAEGKYRDDMTDVLNIKVKNDKGTMVPLAAFVTLKETAGPQNITRFNMFPSAKITTVLRPDKSTSQGIEKMKAITETLPDGFSNAWSDLTYQEMTVGEQTGYIFALSILFAFLILAAQYESWSSPLIIMMAVPLGVAGAITAVFLFGRYGGALLETNVYTQIGLLMMVGLSAKNAILITEFAREHREHGAPLIQSAYEAGRLRLRPIFMTSFAFILGVLPLVWANGAGSNSRNAIGNCVFGGLLMETMIGVYVTPVLFVLIQGTAEFMMKHFRATLAKSHEKAKAASGRALDEVNVRHGD
jgi:HAE1 family hydrophobic/amphiphilic exporter-1